ncbi:DUF1573 domain-containing protein [Hymenobacter humi]|uniref:DUF1573 domain-containing protein n=1 Tax=Hymenobacter humi TaxID=1411620 RepID=A0ABW2U8A1_9BACT
MKKTLLLALSLTAAAYTAQAQATPPVAKAVGPVAGPSITFEESKFDFGSVAQGGIVDHTFKFKNTGTAPLIISNIGVSCGCTTPDWTKAPVLPGKTGTISAKFNSAGKIGMQNKVLTIESNAVGGSTTVALVGEVKEASTTASATPAAHAEASASTGSTAIKDNGKKIKTKTTDSKLKAKVK